MNYEIKHNGIIYYIEIRALPDENGENMEFIVMSIDLDGADYEDLLKMDDLYESIIEQLLERGL